jgi:hypothetical protein
MECPFRRAMYCSICCIHGHCPDDCPNEKAKAIRQGLPADDIQNRTLKISDNEKSIKTFLMIHELTPSSRQHENKKMLLDFANSMEPPHMLIFIPPKSKTK